MEELIERMQAQIFLNEPLHVENDSIKKQILKDPTYSSSRQVRLLSQSLSSLQSRCQFYGILPSHLQKSTVSAVDLQSHQESPVALSEESTRFSRSTDAVCDNDLKSDVPDSVDVTNGQIVEEGKDSDGYTSGTISLSSDDYQYMD